MNKYNLPVLLPPTGRISITQPYGPTDNTLEPVGPHGEPHFHYGVYVIFGDAFNSYGLPLVNPFAVGTFASENPPPGTYENTPTIVINGVGASGNKYQLVLAHVSNVVKSTTYANKQIVGATGNYGTVAPVPSISGPWDGSHLHLGLLVNGNWADPQEYFDFSNAYAGPQHDPNACVDRLSWAVEQFQANPGVHYQLTN